MSAFLALLMQRIRRDRVQLPIWILGNGLLALFASVSVANSYGDPVERTGILLLATGSPAILLLRGLPQGADLGSFVFFEIFIYLALVAAFMSTFLAVRHTRAEEESGRAELVGATPAGRSTPLAATAAYGALAALAMGVSVTLGLVAGRLPPAGAVVTGAAVAATGIAFLGIGLVCAQIVHSARAANALALAVTGVAFLLRGIGAAAGTPSADGVSMTAAWPTWLSPLGWGEESAAFSTGTLSPLLLDLALATVAVAIALIAARRRDLGAALLPDRLGRASARGVLSSSFALAWRLQWPSMLAWALGAAVLGVLVGALAPLADAVTQRDPSLATTLGSLLPAGAAGEGTAHLLLGALFAIIGVLAAGSATQTIIRMRQEEAAGTAELVLSTPLSPLRWLAGYLALGAISIVLVLAAGATAALIGVLGAGSPGETPGTGSSVATGPELGDVGATAVAQLPAAFVYLGVIALVFALVPKATIPLGWGLLGAGLVLGVFGGAVGMPQWLRDISPFQHTPVVVGGQVDWSGGFWMLAVAALAVVATLITGRRRELVLG
ncbi:MAG: hypothetical protein EPO52_04955 [Herbiconiux sp.]|uniref:ABC transporter permease n=1 Tax=Herbiconiux sp. TaxID=1871186 RepID=UPI00121B2016|nr:hypothetical protein [Herbiconiux sp.]TAJ49146.1 MAG: hypothetical protein EPO52_04955 [Herbiconiux sp.]